MHSILITGTGGQLGQDCVTEFASLGTPIALTRDELDLAGPKTLNALLNKHAPKLFVNCAAYTKVDQAESETDLAYKINRDFVKRLGEACAIRSIPVVQISTDYVFNGESEVPYLETDPTDPINVYGQSKLEGEQALQESGCSYLILRTSWVYRQTGQNFLLTMLRLMQERQTLTVVNDQFGCPNWSFEIAKGAAQASKAWLAEDSRTSHLFHLSGHGPATWFDFAKEIEELSQTLRDHRVVIDPVSTEAFFKTAAKRPRFSYLNSDAICSKYGVRLPQWKDQLKTCLKTLPIATL